MQTATPRVETLIDQISDLQPDQTISDQLRHDTGPTGSGWLTHDPITNVIMLAFLHAVSIVFPAIDTRFLINLANPNLPVRLTGQTVTCQPEFLNLPVVGVTWFGAAGLARWVGGQLPTWQEWADAARPQRGNAYPWGNEPPTHQQANFGHSHPGPTPPGHYPVTGNGFHDLSGNVREWCRDRITATGTDAVQRRIAGGGWNSPAEHLAIDHVAGKLPLMGSSSCGFRVHFPQ